jgi:hypothetical protein
MSEYNGWKNETTWTVNILLMETIEQLVKSGYSVDEVATHIYRKLGVEDMNWYGSQVFASAWKQIDWWTLYDRAKENTKQTAESEAE